MADESLVNWQKLVSAISTIESSNNPKAISPVGAKGLMQLMDQTGEEWHDKLGIEEPYDPFDAKQNVKIGTAYIKYLYHYFGGNLELAIAAYNWGMGHVRKAVETQYKTKSFSNLRDELGTYVEAWYQIETEAPAETRSYVPNVLDVYEGLLKT